MHCYRVQGIRVQCRIVYYNAVWYNAMKYNIVMYNAVQYKAVEDNALCVVQCIRAHQSTMTGKILNNWKNITVNCSYSAVH